jgi:serine/threonine-protein kinase
VQSASTPGGVVVEQTPPGGSTAGQGATVALKVSKGPTTAAVPDVTNEDAATAVTNLRQSGFKVTRVSQLVTDPSNNGIVVDQTPPAGTQAPRSSSVTIFVGTFPGGTGGTTTTP